MKHINFNLSVAATVVLLTACGGGAGGSGNGEPVAEPTATPSTTATPSSSGTPTPAPTHTPTPTPTACTAAPINPAEPYSLVFKGCDANNVPTYYEKTECVRQNSTGLIWQGQMPAGSGHLRANDQGKTNYDNTNLAQQVSVSLNGLTIIHTPSSDTVNSLSNSIGFASAVKATKLCGLTNWSVANSRELQTLGKLSAFPKIDNAWFPNTAPDFYWTSDSTLSDATVGFAINFGNPMLSNFRRDKPYLVRLVERTYYVP